MATGRGSRRADLRYEVLTYGRKELRRKAEPVARIDDGIRQLAQDMVEAMHRNRGVGLAAEQVGRNEALFVVDIPPARDESGQAIVLADPPVDMPLVLINPRILEESGEQSDQEGCLSFPEIFVSITRAEHVLVEYLALDGETHQLRASGLLSRAIQHETDHLNGVLLVDRMSPVQKIAIAGRLKRLKKQRVPVPA
jgi:peptide deformylase